MLMGRVPQGSKVGPIAFIIKINQLPSVIRDEMILYLACNNEGYVIADETIMFMDDTRMFKVLGVNYTSHFNRFERCNPIKLLVTTFDNYNTYWNCHFMHEP